jgi:integrase
MNHPDTTTSTPLKAKKLRPKIAFKDVHFRNRSIKPEAEPYEVGDAVQRGLRLYVSTKGEYGWRVRYRYPKGPAGKPRVLVLQSGVTLEQARKLASDAMFKLSQGVDPGVQRKADIQSAQEEKQRASLTTMRSVFERFMEMKGNELRTAHSRKRQMERLILPTLGGMQVDEITKSLMTALLDKIEQDNGDRTADIMLAAVNRALNWHESRSDDFVNPLRRMRPRRENPKDYARERFLTDDEIRDVWAATFKTPGLYGPVVRFLLLTGCRRSEATDLRWSEIEGDLWTLPASRSKSKRKVIRPLSKAALEVVNSMPRIVDCPFVFPGRYNHTPYRMNKPECHQVLLDASPNTKFAGPWTLHDLRRTFTGKLIEAEVRVDIREMLLGHTLPLLRHHYEANIKAFFPAMRDAVEKVAAEIERITGKEKQPA